MNSHAHDLMLKTIIEVDLEDGAPAAIDHALAAYRVLTGCTEAETAKLSVNALRKAARAYGAKEDRG